MHKKVILTIVILFLLYIILGVVLPPLRHRKAGEQGRQSFTSEQPEGERILCLDDNEEALLWRLKVIESGANPFGCIDYVNEKEELLETGAEMYECIADHSLHTKTILVDDRLSAVGSYNYDMRSTYLDTEMMLVIDSPELNRELREQAGELMDQSRHVRPDGTVVRGEDYPDRELSAGKRFFYQILRILIMPFRHLL